MTGWRIGYIAGNKHLVKAIGKLQGQSTSCPNSIAQHAAIEALAGNQKCVETMRNTFKKRRDLIIQELLKIPNVACEVPNGAFYVFPNFSKYLNSNDGSEKTLKTASDLSLYILNTTGVVTVAGDSFGAPGFIRLSYATSEETIIKAIALIQSALKKLTFK